MAGFSTTVENQVVDHLLRPAVTGTPLERPTALYVALFTDVATDAELEAGTLTNEVAPGANAYARQGVTFIAPTDGATSNDAAISWTNMPAVTVAWAAVMDTASGAGRVLFFGAVSPSKTLNAGDTFTINAGDLDVSVA